MYVYTHCAQYGEAGRARDTNIGTAVNAACKKMFPGCHLGTHAIDLSALLYSLFIIQSIHQRLYNV